MPEPRHTVVFQPMGLRLEVAHAEPLRQAARRAGVELPSLCGERLVCGKCWLQVQAGHFERLGLTSHPDHLSSMTETEAAFWAGRGRRLVPAGVDAHTCRLSCQAQVLGDLVVWVPDSSRAAAPVISKAAGSQPVAVRPAVRQLYVELSPATLSDPSAGWERLKAALLAVDPLERRSGDLPLAATDLSIDLPALLALQPALRQAGGRLTVTLWQAPASAQEVIRIQPGYQETLAGLAVDIGTTTLAAHLCDLRSGEVLATADMLNPQVAYGEDILARISYAGQQPHGLQTLQHAVRHSLLDLARAASAQAGLAPEEIVDLVVVGNSVMHHLFLGLDPTALGQAPYVPAIHQALDVRARDLGLCDGAIHPGARVHLLPLIASFVGADCTAALLAAGLHEQDQLTLLVDVGTNAELVLGDRRRLVCTSTPTGPAFEGAHITHGMRAAPGAIERVAIDPQTLQPLCQTVGSTAQASFPARGLCGSGLIDAVAGLYQAGLVAPDGRLVSASPAPNLRSGPEGAAYQLAPADEARGQPEIAITQADIRQLQLAKAPLYVAARYLLEALGAGRPQRILLAGGFGVHIDPLKAMLIGMLPDCPLEQVQAIGNAAGDGARLALLNREKRQEAAALAGRLERIELPARPGFHDQFFLALHFPHMTDLYPSLEGLAPPRPADPVAQEWLGEETQRNG